MSHQLSFDRWFDKTKGCRKACVPTSLWSHWDFERVIDYFTDCFYLPVWLQMIRCWEKLHNFPLCKESINFYSIKLIFVIRDDHLRESEITYNIFPNEPGDLFMGDLRKRFNFYPLGEIIDGHYCKFCTAWGHWQKFDEVDPYFAKGRGLQIEASSSWARLIIGANTWHLWQDLAYFITSFHNVSHK